MGEERNGAGAYRAAQGPRGSKVLINGEPTENRLALGSKGALRYEIAAEGKMAHSAYPELGESAIDKLLNALDRLRHIELPVDEVLGPSTLNIGTLSGGRAPNIIADHARAEIMIRLVGDSRGTREAVLRAVKGCAEAREVLEIPAIRLGRLDGFGTTVVAYTTDIPAFGGTWVDKAVPDRAWLHSRSPYIGRTRAEKATRGSSGNLSTHGETVMEARIEVGILGATGMVGQHFIKFLQGHPWFDVKWLGASDRSVGKKYRDATKWHLQGVMPDREADLVVEECKPNHAPRLLFSSMDSSVATEIERAFAEAGHIIVSNSKNHRHGTPTSPYWCPK